jgi:hypothetical protein
MARDHLGRDPRHFAPQLDAAADKLATALPKALPAGADPDTVLKHGPKGIAAAVVADAEATISELVTFLRTVAAEIDEELPISRFVSADDAAPPVESGLFAGYIRDGYKRSRQARSSQRR